MLGTAGTAAGCAVFQARLGRAALVAWCLACALLFAAIDYHWRRMANVMPETKFNWRAFLVFVNDVCAAAIAWVTLYGLRFNLDVPEPFSRTCGARWR